MSIANLLTDNLKVWQNLQVNSLEAFSIDSVNIRTDVINGLNSNAVTIPNINTNVIDINQGTRLLIQRPTAYIFNEEYSQYNLSFTGVNLISGFVQPASFAVINAGAPSYMPISVSPFRLNILEQGVYVFNFVARNLGVLVASDGYQVRIVNNTTNTVVANMSELVGIGTAIGEYNIHVNGTVPFNANDSVRFEIALSNGLSVVPQNFNAVLYVYRMK